ncbi:hypothetical protein [Psychrobacter sp. SWN149]|uniref:hypothetical protein n=1 Tax=Psychrobacter sp. SWN149 TaxID=2792057 RepID=UPI0018CC835F|nr:hypothetical protein [Psychrobacter sp. SWN149]MBH0005648.1 hypothetical protein [Psychrobacter sp. SWN149]
MSILIGIGIITTVTTFYLGKKGWQAFHKAVGITPGVLVYQNDNAPLSLSTVKWQQLSLNNKHLKNLPEQQLRQLKRIDEKVNHYQAYQTALQAQHKTPAITEQQFVLNKMMHTRLPEMLASHHHLVNVNRNIHKRSGDNVSTDSVGNDNKAEANELLQSVLNNIEQRLDKLLAQMDTQQLQELRVMKNYINGHDS